MRSPYPSLIPPKLVQKGGIKEIPPRALPTQELKKPQNRAPLLTDLGGNHSPKNHEGFFGLGFVDQPKKPSGFLVNHRKPRELGIASANLHS
jgi:hypothetical protein